VSILALFKRPRGFAIAGTVIGLLLTAVVGSVATGLYLFSNQWKGGVAIGMVSLQEELLETQILAYQRETGSLPESLDVVNLPDGVKNDPWGNAYLYTVSDSGTWVISSVGPDGQAGTSDDIDDLGSLVERLNDQDAAKEWIDAANRDRDAWPGFMEIIQLGQSLGEWQQANENASAVAGGGQPTPPAVPAPEDAPETPETP
jgi:hypothetical protein